MPERRERINSVITSAKCHVSLFFGFFLGPRSFYFICLEHTTLGMEEDDDNISVGSATALDVLAEASDPTTPLVLADMFDTSYAESPSTVVPEPPAPPNDVFPGSASRNPTKSSNAKRKKPAAKRRKVRER